MPVELPHIPLDLILDPVSIDLTDDTNTYPLLEDLAVADSVGPEAANRQPRALDLRTESMRSLMNNLTDVVNALNTNFLHRDGADAIQGGSPASSFMQGNLSMTDATGPTAYRVTNTADGVSDTDAVTKGQLDVLSSFLTTLNGELVDFLRRDGTAAMTANLSFGNNQAVDVADPTNVNDAVTKQYADAKFDALNEGFLKRDGSLAMIGNLNAGGNKVVNLDLSTPSSVGDAVSRGYLLTVISAVAETPSGTLTWYAGDASVSIPTGWLIADGRTVVRATYAALFGVISTQYNTGGESALDFRLPDLRGRALMCMDDIGTGSAGVVTNSAADLLGGTLGTETHALSTSEMPSHAHTYDDAYVSGDTAGTEFGPSTTDSNNEFNEIAGRTSGTAGSGSAHNNMQPSIALFALIKFVILLSFAPLPI